LKLLLPLSLNRLPLLGRVGDLVEAVRKFFLLLSQLLGSLGKLRSIFPQRLRGLLRIARRLGSLLSRLIKLPGLSLLARLARIRSRLSRRLGRRRIRSRLLSRVDGKLSRLHGEVFLLLNQFLSRRLPALRLRAWFTFRRGSLARLLSGLASCRLTSRLSTFRRRSLRRSCFRARLTTLRRILFRTKFCKSLLNLTLSIRELLSLLGKLTRSGLLSWLRLT
jgi:hypothetical protein